MGMCFQVCVTDRNPSQGAFSCDQDKTQSPQPLHLPGSEVGRDPGVEGWASDGEASCAELNPCRPSLAPSQLPTTLSPVPPLPPPLLIGNWPPCPWEPRVGGEGGGWVRRSGHNTPPWRQAVGGSCQLERNGHLLELGVWVVLHFA